MIELIVVWCFGRATYETARQKGRSGGLWVLLLTATWIAAELIGAIAVHIGWLLIYGTFPHALITYAAALVCAITASVLLGKFLDGRSSLIPPPLPAPMRQPSIKPAQSTRRVPKKSAPPPPMKFKFACPHCGQRISATTDALGTEADCPTCHNAFIVGSTESPAVEASQQPRQKFKFACPSCGQRISSMTDVTGTEATCPTCHDAFIVESAKLATSEPPQGPQEAIKFSCPHCGQRISSTADVVGTEAACPICCGVFTVELAEPNAAEHNARLEGAAVA